MIQLDETIHVAQPLEKVFAYVSDFAHIQEWDPGVVSSVSTRPGPVTSGSTYDLTLRFGLSRPSMRYVVKEYKPFSKVVLTGEGRSFSATDTIEFNQSGTGTQIHYQADIRFSGGKRFFEPFLAPLLKRSGKKSMQGLEAALNSRSGPPSEKKRFASGTSLFDYLADHAVLPGMLMFSRYGYEISQRFWSEPGEIMTGKTVILTGGTSGIGRAAAFSLAEKKAGLTIIARNRRKAEQVCKEIIEKTGNPSVDFLVADLSLMSDISRVAEKVREKTASIDVLINNAGALFNERLETSEGFEQTFATDLLGVFYLTMLLKDALAASAQARVINVSSGGMYTQKIDVTDLENRLGTYNGAKAYARAKRGVVILTRLWAEKFRSDRIVVHAMHPGWVDTPGIQRSLPGFTERVRNILRTPEQGADTIVWLASAQKAVQSSGLFWLDRRPRETVLLPGTGESEQEREKLWKELNALSDHCTIS